MAKVVIALPLLLNGFLNLFRRHAIAIDGVLRGCVERPGENIRYANIHPDHILEFFGGLEPSQRQRF